MKFLLKLKNKYAIYCPLCKSELYWEASIKKTDILECKNCKKYFKYRGNKKNIIEDESHASLIYELKLKTKGEYVEPFNKTSDFYAPEWLKRIVKKRKEK